MSQPPAPPVRPPFVLDDSEWSHKAWMSRTDADLFERVVARKSQAADHFDALEWGAGRSTLYFHQLLQDQGRTGRWLSLEYDRAFVEAAIVPALTGNSRARVITPETPLAPAAGEGMTLEVVAFDKGKLQPFLPDHETDRLADLDDYVAYPGTLGRQFDLIFVDGRKRRRCLIEAAKLVKPDGLVLLHDAYRPHYQCAFDHYRSHRMLGEILWIGSPSLTNFLEWIA